MPAVVPLFGLSLIGFDRYCHVSAVTATLVMAFNGRVHPRQGMAIRGVPGVPLVVPDAKQAIWKRFPAQIQLWPNLGVTSGTAFGLEAGHAAR